MSRKTVSFRDTETRIIASDPAFGPVKHQRNLNYWWPEDIRGLNSSRERRRFLLDDVDAKTLGNDACVLELSVSKRSACEVFPTAAKSVKRIRRLMLDSGCGIDLIGLGGLSHDERQMIVQNGKTNTRGLARVCVCVCVCFGHR